MEIKNLTPPQYEFYKYVMKRIQAGKEEEADALLSEALERHNAGTFTKEYLTEFGVKIMSLIKFDCMAEFLSASKDFADKLLKN
jgi:negative regulator of genetic competence, sporulation and motility